MNMNYFIIGTAVIIVGAGVLYLLRKGGDGNSLSRKQITIKETDNIKLSILGDWLKDKNVDLEDFGGDAHLFVLKTLQDNNKDLNLPKEVIAQINKASDKKVVSFVLSDRDYNTKEVLIVFGDTIDPGLEVKLTKDVTELNIK